MTFLNVWSNPMCTPSRAGIFSGKHVFNHGLGHPKDVTAAGGESLEASLAGDAALPEMLPGTYRSGLLVALDELTDEYAMNLFHRFARNGTTYDPALVAYRTFMQEAVDLAPKDPRYERAAAGRTKMFNRFVELVGLMNRAGVTVVAGTDFGIRPETVAYPVARARIRSSR